MDVATAIRERRSIRSFMDRAIEDEKLALLKDALIWAPSSGNLQMRRFYFVFNGRVREGLAGAAFGQGFIARAPLVVAACGDLDIYGRYGERGVELYCIQDVACSVQNMMLQAHDLGLGSVWVGAFDASGVSRCLGLAGNLWPLALVPVGYPARRPAPPKRVAVDSAVVEVR